MKFNKFLSKIEKIPVMFGIYLILVFVAGTQAILLTQTSAEGGKPVVTRYNNYVIFKHSHLHLLEGKDLYKAYPDEHWDLYKYSPTFALFFGCFAWFPDWLGLTLWNLLNMVVFFMAIRFFPGLNEKQRWLILLLSAADMMTSLQNSQSNVLVAGLIILGFVFFEKRNFFLATLCIVATFYIKIFGIAAIIVLLFYPEKTKSILYTVFWMGILWIIPVFVTGFHPLLDIYSSYLQLLRDDQSVSLGISVMGWLNAWFGLAMPKALLALAGVLMLGSTLLNWNKFNQYPARVFFLSALLVWMVIFNHKAESPTFIIATSGIFLWYFIAQKSVTNLVLLIVAVVFTSLAATDLFPPFVRDQVFEPYVVKVVPCILVWVKILADLTMFKGEESRV
jgi:hypothetical protein